MRIFLASFLESYNFGPGRVIGVANGNKPRYIKCDLVFLPLIPTNEIMAAYNDMANIDHKTAAENFTKSFIDQLDTFYNKVQLAAQEANKTPTDILPLMDGDTLASWEREEFANYRPLIANCLVRLGYEVVRH